MLTISIRDGPDKSIKNKSQISLVSRIGVICINHISLILSGPVATCGMQSKTKMLNKSRWRRDP
jgi:hypothetical protein